MEGTTETTQLSNTPAVPWEHQLWTAEEVGAHLRVSPRTVLERYAARPGFPKAVRPGGYPRWYAAEICEWVAETRSACRKGC